MITSVPNKVFLTGATGFIGSHVAEYFSREGQQLVCGVRTDSDTSFLQTLPVEVRVADLLDRLSLVRAMDGCGFVIHTAGMVNDWSRQQAFFETNVLGTRNVMHAAFERGIDHVITTGSSASYGEEDSPIVKSEASPDKPRYPYFLERIIPNRLNFYRTTKHRSTLEAMEFARQHNMNLTVVEPVWVYGEREFSSGFYEYMKVVGGGIPFFPGSSKNHFHVIYAGDLARAYFLVFKKRIQGVHRMLVGNTRVDRMSTIYDLFCKELGVRKPSNLPRAAVYPVGLIMELAAELVGSRKPPLLSRSRVNMMYDNISYSTQNAEELTGFRAEMPLREGIARTVKWYRDNQLIKSKP